jgi:tetratricopeptide (TPR) repeat protein/DNA-binding CsgD family transcriptional regulator
MKSYTIILLYIILLFNVKSTLAIHSNIDYDSIAIGLKHLENDIPKVNKLIELGKHYCSRENEKAIVVLQEAFMLSTNLKYQHGIALSYLWLGRVYYYKDNYDISLNYLDKAKDLFTNLQDNEHLIFTIISIEQNHALLGKNIEAFSDCIQALHLSDSLGITKYKNGLYHNLGNVYLRREQFDIAIKYFNEAILYSEKPNSAGLANSYCSIGTAYEMMGFLDSALYYQNKALRIREEMNNIRHIAASSRRIGCLMIKMGNYREAEEFLNKALNIFKKFKDDTGIAITKIRIALARCKSGDKDAMIIAKQSLKIAKDVENPYLERDIYEVMSEMENFMGNFEQSMLYLKKHYNLNDSLFTAEKERILSEYQTEFETQRKDNLIRILKDENIIQKKNNLLYISLIAFLVLALGLIVFLIRNKSKAIGRKQVLLEQNSIIEIQKKEISEKENAILKEQLESKNRELASKTLEMVRFNDTISSVIRRLEEMELADGNNIKSKDSIKRIIFELDNHAKNDLWAEFDEIFKNIHSSFYDSLLEICNDLSSTEIKTASLLRLNLTTKEIAAITFKSESSIKTARYRLRKKLGLASDDKLVPFLLKI